MQIDLPPDFAKPAGTALGFEARGRVLPTETIVDEFAFGLDRARINLSRTTIKAPWNAVVADADASVAANANATQFGSFSIRSATRLPLPTPPDTRARA